MKLYDGIWMYMKRMTDVYEPIWGCSIWWYMNVNGSKWMYMKVYEAVWWYMNAYEGVRDVYEPIWMYMKVYECKWW